MLDFTYQGHRSKVEKRYHDAITTFFCFVHTAEIIRYI